MTQETSPQRKAVEEMPPADHVLALARAENQLLRDQITKLQHQLYHANRALEDITEVLPTYSDLLPIKDMAVEDITRTLRLSLPSRIHPTPEDERVYENIAKVVELVPAVVSVRQEAMDFRLWVRVHSPRTGMLSYSMTPEAWANASPEVIAQSLHDMVLHNLKKEVAQSSRSVNIGRN